jgi:hypothetical protein
LRERASHRERALPQKQVYWVPVSRWEQESLAEAEVVEVVRSGRPT